jgi:hypothetical protein
VRMRGMVQGFDDAQRQHFGICHNIGQTGIDDALRHAVEFCIGRFLRQNQAAELLDCAHAERAVRTHAGEDDANRVLAPVVCQGAEEKINRQAQAARRDRFKQAKAVMQNRQIAVRRNHIDVIRHYLHAVFGLQYLHYRCSVATVQAACPAVSGSRCWMTTKAMPQSTGT